MNGTVIDIPGIAVGHQTIDCQYGPDQAHVITLRDQVGNEVNITICYGKITAAQAQFKEKE